MPWVTINGEKKKVACGPCIRGHRSSKCEHKDRILLEVRKPGRPLSSCPHPAGSCSCERMVINYTIPKSSECACPATTDDATEPNGGATASSSTTNRVEKKKRKKSIKSATPALERALTDTQTEQNGVQPKAERPSTPSTSTATSPSVTSTPPPTRKRTLDEVAASASVQTNGVISATNGHFQGESQVANGEAPKVPRGSCCGSKATAPAPSPPPKRSCCSSNSSAPKQVRERPAPDGKNANSTNGIPQAVPYTQPASTGSHTNGYAQRNAPYSNFALSPDQAFAMGLDEQQMMAHNYIRPNMSNSNITLQGVPHIHNAAINGTVSHCDCGDGCACLGCSAHPRNDTTMRYVRSMTEFMMNNTYYDTSQHFPQNRTYPPSTPEYGFQHTPMMGSGGFMFAQPVQPVKNGASGAYSNGHYGWSNMTPQGSVQATPTHELEGFHLQSPQDLRYTQQFPSTTEASAPPIQLAETKPELIDLERVEERLGQKPLSPEVFTSGAEIEPPTLSPSSFFLQQLELPGCNDESGTCMCGDGCSCVGCLTHGGHNGVALETPTGQEFDTFLDQTFATQPP